MLLFLVWIGPTQKGKSKGKEMEGFIDPSKSLLQRIFSMQRGKRIWREIENDYRLIVAILLY